MSIAQSCPPGSSDPARSAAVEGPEPTLAKIARDFHDIFDHAADAMIIHDLDGALLEVNRAACDRLGYTRDVLLQKRVADLLAPEALEGFLQGVERLRTDGYGQIDSDIITRDGGRFTAEVAARVVEFCGAPAVLAIARDIGRHREAAEEIRQARDTQAAIAAILRLALEDTPLDELLGGVLQLMMSVPWLGVERRGVIFLASRDAPVLERRASYGLEPPLRAMCERVPFGRCHCGRAAASGAMHVGKALHENVYDGVQPHGHCTVPIRMGGVTLGVITTYLAPNQELKPEQVEFLRAVSDTLAGVLARRRAEEERERAGEQLRQAQKLDALGRLAGGVAHDFNNVLSVILGTAEAACAELRPEDPLRDDLDEILRSGRRGADLTRQLLAFCRREVSRPEILCVSDVVSGLERMLARLIGENLTLTTKRSGDLRPVSIDRAQLEQVIVNLVVNARDAIHDSGEVTIAVSDGAPESGRSGVAGGSHLRLTVTDTGRGIAPEILPHIFEPFFTTKENGKGTGLGLAMVHGIVESAGGEIDVTSSPGVGSTFCVRLPFTEAGETPRPPKRPASMRAPVKATVLIVDDEPGLRRVAARLLARAGWNVLEAVGKDALAVSRAHAGSIELLLSDVVMPDISGPRLAEALRAERPGLRVVLMSGYPDPALAGPQVLPPDVPLLHKPFRKQELLAAAAAAIG
ncbi:MAG: PAS domain S-box protein [Deltaproteobacteria bacterium]|nr:PAS domain S-box protein [Deltaproteobacteria bacterium]